MRAKPQLPWPWNSPKVSVIGKRCTVSIPEIHVVCPADEQERWVKMRSEWFATGKEGAWKGYKVLGCDSYGFPPKEVERVHGFVEAFVARLLYERGFRCWRGARIMDTGNVKEPTRVYRTEGVERELRDLGHEVPRDFIKRHGLKNFTNPDLVAFSDATPRLLFCEVKRKDRLSDKQLRGLGLLHLLTRGQVAIVKLIEPHSRSSPPKTHIVVFDEPEIVKLAR